ncbi:hypothetical protein CW304_27575 [Bacillus sp. UFRGS-B20]|nr:hypothetical protein CW304_27575 [Bacillus sp. UFRGS-B20]
MLILHHKERQKKYDTAYLHTVLTTLHDNLENSCKEKNNSVTATASGFFSYLTSYHATFTFLIVK